MATLNYTTESRGFEYKDGQYTLTGNKVSKNGAMTTIDGGNVHKAGAFLGSFYVRFEQGQPKITVSNVAAAEIVDVINHIDALVATLAEE